MSNKRGHPDGKVDLRWALDDIVEELSGDDKEPKPMSPGGESAERPEAAP
jgi:hypothetical protein